MSKVTRQMLQQCGRVGVALGEAACDPISDETRDPLHEHPDTGSAKQLVGTGGLLEAALTVMTSNSRTARCGPACRVVWEGRVSSPPRPD